MQGFRRAGPVGTQRGRTEIPAGSRLRQWAGLDARTHPVLGGAHTRPGPDRGPGLGMVGVPGWGHLVPGQEAGLGAQATPE